MTVKSWCVVSQPTMFFALPTIVAHNIVRRRSETYTIECEELTYREASLKADLLNSTAAEIPAVDILEVIPDTQIDAESEKVPL